MRSLSRIECFNVGCTNEASVTINGDHVCTQCAKADLPSDMHPLLNVVVDARINEVLSAAKFIVTYETIDSDEECEKEFNTVAEAEVFIASMEDLLVTCGVSDEHGDIDLDHYCRKHSARTGEGNICGQCEAEFDKYRDALNAEMLKHKYELRFVLSKQYMYRCPVSNFDEAKMLQASLSCPTGVRIARHDPTQGCESVLHKFN